MNIHPSNSIPPFYIAPPVVLMFLAGVVLFARDVRQWRANRKRDLDDWVKNARRLS